MQLCRQYAWCTHKEHAHTVHTQRAHTHSTYTYGAHTQSPHNKPAHRDWLISAPLDKEVLLPDSRLLSLAQQGTPLGILPSQAGTPSPGAVGRCPLPLAVWRSTSTVGFPRESRISRAQIFSMDMMARISLGGREGRRKIRGELRIIKLQCVSF